MLLQRLASVRASLPTLSGLSELLARWGGERVGALSLVALAVAINLVLLFPEATVDAPDLNDGVLHLLAIDEAAEALGSGRNPTDTWLGSMRDLSQRHVQPCGW